MHIVHQQCRRTNGIVESVLGLARRELAQPENIDLVVFVRRFLDDYLETIPPDLDDIKFSHGVPTLPVLVDPRHLQQVLTVLVQNSLRYGRMPGQPARVILRVERRGEFPVIEVLDRGPGIPDAVVAQLFRPFFTTSEHGTGLGLYIARELCRANGANLESVSVPAGGACFRPTDPAAAGAGPPLRAAVGRPPRDIPATARKAVGGLSPTLGRGGALRRRSGLRARRLVIFCRAPSRPRP